MDKVKETADRLKKDFAESTEKSEEENKEDKEDKKEEL